MLFRSIGDNADADDDGDGIPDAEELKLGLNPLIADGDEDGYNDSIDAFPKDPSEWIDTDGDGVGDNSDKFPTIRYYQTYSQAILHLVIALAVLGVVGFSIKMGRARANRPEDEDAEMMEIGGVAIPVTADATVEVELADRDLDYDPDEEMETEAATEPEEAEVEDDEFDSAPSMYDLESSQIRRAHGSTPVPS